MAGVNCKLLCLAFVLFFLELCSIHLKTRLFHPRSSFTGLWSMRMRGAIGYFLLLAGSSGGVQALSGQFCSLSTSNSIFFPFP